MSSSSVHKKITTTMQALLRSGQFSFLHALEKHASEAEVYLVGGAVRDIVLGRATTDYDFIVCGVPARTLHVFLKKHGQVDLVGKRFGVFKFTPKGYAGEAIDIALPRTDFAYAGGGGYKDFDIQTDPHLPIENDLARRDFTVNAIAAMVPGTVFKKGTRYLIDPFGGLDDIQKKILRTVGKPEDRFAEDYSRMLRGLRFACQLGFTIDATTWRALRKKMPEINRKRDKMFIVPRDAVGKELVKSFADNPLCAVDLWDRSGAFAAVMPEVLAMKKCPQPRRFHAEGDVWTHSVMALQEMTSARFRRIFPTVEQSALFALAVFLHDVGKPATLRTPKSHGVDRIRTDGHDTEGARMVEDIAMRLKLFQFPKEDTRLHVDHHLLTWLIAHHMLLSEHTARVMTATTLERYFLRDRYKGSMFKALIWCDSRATVPPSGTPNLGHLRIVNRRLGQIEKRLEGTRTKPLLSGDELMRIAGIKTGPYVGQLLEKLREEQLTGRVRTKKHAQEFIKKLGE